MKRINSNISGIFHQQLSNEYYNLRRYLPSKNLANLVELFWFVNWDLPNGVSHTQQNLPDPNFHLVVKNNSVKIITPISKKYTYTMKGNGEIIGVKFNIGALAKDLKFPAITYIDKELASTEFFNFEPSILLENLVNTNNDEDKTHILEAFLLPYCSPNNSKIKLKNLQRTIKLMKLIKNTPEITSVEKLSKLTNIPVRTIQRYFKEYIGFSPKWIIRKYRLHQALEELENSHACMADIVSKLGYTDQSHLIKDFKEIIGVNPTAYLSQKKVVD